jgi:hypothetical protein
VSAHGKDVLKLKTATKLQKKKIQIKNYILAPSKITNKLEENYAAFNQHIASPL